MKFAKQVNFHKTKNFGRFGHNLGEVNMAKGIHPGFKTVAEGIARNSGIPLKNAGAILASRTRNASASAKKANPRLKRVKG